jgi:hypothetical protein
MTGIDIRVISSMIHPLADGQRLQISSGVRAVKTDQPLLDFLATCSEISLQSFELARLSEISNYKKQISELLDEWVETDVQARLAEWALKSRRQQLQRRSAKLRRKRVAQRQDRSLPLFPAQETPPRALPPLPRNTLVPLGKPAAAPKSSRRASDFPLSRAM